VKTAMLHRALVRDDDDDDDDDEQPSLSSYSTFQPKILRSLLLAGGKRD